MRIDLEAMDGDRYEAYRAECDSRSSAEFRMRRELCGIELSEMADDLGVRIDTAKRWENPKKGQPPSLRAWAYVDSACMQLMDAVEEAVRKAEDAAEESGDLYAIGLAYRRGVQASREGWTVGRANAAARASAVALSVLGYGFAVGWADDGAAGSASAAER